MNETSFGIDLGTSTSIVSIIMNGRPMPISDPETKSAIVPSVIGLNRRGELVAGQRAIDDALPDAKIREAKRQMGTSYRFRLGGDELAPEEVGALVLRKIRENAERTLGRTIDRAVITVPAYFDDLPRRATERAAVLAGIEPIRLISEPVAAAMAYGIDRLDDEGMLLVFDFGGGTLDVTIIEMLAGVLEVKATDGDKALGGKDIDEALMRYAVHQGGFSMPAETSKSWDQLKKEVERAKKALSSGVEVDIDVPAFQVSGGDVQDLLVTVTRPDFESLIEPFISRALQKVAGCLAKASLSKDRIHRLLLVGGTCYIPRVREAVETYFALKAETGVDPDLAVSMGAAISAGLKTGEIDARTSVLVQDAATHRMGTSALEMVGDRRMMLFSELMPANASIPFVRTVRYWLQSLDQDQVEIDILEDPRGDARLPADAIPTGAVGYIVDIPPSTTSEPRAVDVEFRYDENHIIRVHAKVVGLDRDLTLQLNHEAVHPNPLKLTSANALVNDLWEKSPLASKNASLIRRAETVLAERPVNGERIEAALEELKRAVANNDPAATQDARERLTDLLVDL